MKTFSPSAKHIQQEWHVVDAEGQRLGRLASQTAQLLRGKHRPTFAPHLDNGDFVVIVNAAKVKVTGNKLQQKLYRRHSGYPGGLRETSLEHMLERHPERVIQQAVKGMLPHNRLSRHLLRHLKVYGGPDHPHEAQVNAGRGGKKAEATQPAETEAEAEQAAETKAEDES